MQAKERMWLTQDRARLVKEGDPEAAVLYAVPGTVIPESAVERFGLKGGRLTKSRKPAEDKAKAKGEDKAAKPKGGLSVEPESKRRGGRPKAAAE